VVQLYRLTDLVLETTYNFQFFPLSPRARNQKRKWREQCWLVLQSVCRHGCLCKKVKAARSRLPSGFRSWSRFSAVSLQVMWVLNPAVGCHYFPSGLQLPPQPLRGLLPILLLVDRGTMGVNSLPKTVTWQRRDCDLNPCSSELESSTLTTRLRCHTAYPEKIGCDVTYELDPVCGSDGVTYHSPSEAFCARVRLLQVEILRKFCLKNKNTVKLVIANNTEMFRQIYNFDGARSVLKSTISGKIFHTLTICSLKNLARTCLTGYEANKLARVWC